MGWRLFQPPHITVNTIGGLGPRSLAVLDCECDDRGCNCSHCKQPPALSNKLHSGYCMLKHCWHLYPEHSNVAKLVPVGSGSFAMCGGVQRMGLAMGLFKSLPCQH